jgi:hypothetical protein
MNLICCASGDIHGAMDRLYQDVFKFEAAFGVRFDYILHVGDFGIWPDQSRIDKATRYHEGAGDFPVWLEDNRGMPRPTEMRIRALNAVRDVLHRSAPQHGRRRS